MALDPGAILFQDCQFLVYKAIDITSTKVSVIDLKMANCFITVTPEHPGYNSDRIIDSNTKVLFRVWNVTIYVNNTYYTSVHEDFDYYFGNDIVVRESYFAAGKSIPHSQL